MPPDILNGVYISVVTNLDESHLTHYRHHRDILASINADEYLSAVNLPSHLICVEIMEVD